MKFSTSAKAGILLLLAMGAVHGLLKVSELSLSQKWLSTGLSILLLLVSCGLYCGLHLLKHRLRARETLEIGRRGLMITHPEEAPVALAWRMIQAADLVPGPPSYWSFRLKNGGQMLLREAEFSREQWKKICTQLERKLRARKVPVQVRTSGLSSTPSNG
jgi:hypothetical protein